MRTTPVTHKNHHRARLARLTRLTGLMWRMMNLQEMLHMISNMQNKLRHRREVSIEMETPARPITHIKYLIRWRSKSNLSKITSIVRIRNVTSLLNSISLFLKFRSKLTEIWQNQDPTLKSDSSVGPKSVGTTFIQENYVVRAGN